MVYPFTIFAWLMSDYIHSSCFTVRTIFHWPYSWCPEHSECFSDTGLSSVPKNIQLKYHKKKDVTVLLLTSHHTVFFCSRRPSPLPQDFPKLCLQFSYWYASVTPLLNTWPIHKSSIVSLVFYLRLNNNLPSFTPEFTFQSSVYLTNFSGFSHHE